VLRMEGDVITTQDLFTFTVEEITAARSVIGSLRPTGLRPTFVPKLERRGIQLPAGMVEPLPANPAGEYVRSIAR